MICIVINKKVLFFDLFNGLNPQMKQIYTKNETICIYIK
jgi:hypothetical protein